MRTFEIEYIAEGLRVPIRGKFQIAATSEQDAMRACLNRWPDMVVTSVREVAGSNP